MFVETHIKRLKTVIKAGLKGALEAWNEDRSRYYALSNESEPLPEHLLQAVSQIRGLDRPPALIVHGVMPRSGTVYCGELIRLHPDIVAYPYDLWEVPLLQAKKQVDELQSAFLDGYRINSDKLVATEFQCIIGAAFIGYMHAALPPGKRLLLKVPRAGHLNYFSSMFPMENALLLMRDGRNIVESTLKTWPDKNFKETTGTWRDATRMMLQVAGEKSGGRNCKLYNYEDVSRAPVEFVEDMCSVYGLEQKKYPFEQIHDLPARGSSSLSKTGQVDWKPKPKPKKFKANEHWQDWDARKKANFKRIAGQELIKAGYERDNTW
ncbi:MAG: sulfotransferase [Pseudomonadales bacterium]|nr:sulfotransferase [Pseudomonadales bacterium]